MDAHPRPDIDSDCDHVSKRRRIECDDPMIECDDEQNEEEEEEDLSQIIYKTPPRGELPPERKPKTCTTIDGRVFDPTQWQRPPCHELMQRIENKEEEYLTYQQLTTDYIIASSSWFPENGHPQYNYVPVIRTFGVTEEGHSVCHFTTGFFPYCFIRAPVQRLTKRDTDVFKKVIENKLRAKNCAEDHDVATRDRKTSELLMGKGTKRMSDIKNNVIVHSVEVEYKFSARDYHEKKIPVYKVSFTLPHYVVAFRNLVKESALRPWESDVSLDWKSWVTEDCDMETHDKNVLSRTLYEDDINFELRYMIDRNLSGFGWCQVPLKDKRAPYFIRKGSKSMTRCQIEIQSNQAQTLIHDTKKEPWLNKMSNFRVLAFDTEWQSADLAFPKPESAKMIQVAVYIKEFTAKDPNEAKRMAEEEKRKVELEEKKKMSEASQSLEYLVGSLDNVNSKRARIITKLYKAREANALKNMASSTTTESIHTMAKIGLTLRNCSAIEGADVYSFQDEMDLHLSLSSLIRESDPDIITGYNIDGFDLKMWLERSGHLGVRHIVSKYSRCKNYESYYRKATLESRAFGKNERIDHVVPGRVCFDLLAWMQREVKARSYTLNAISKEILKDQKDDVDHTMIPILQNGTDDDRMRLMKYCFKDAYLCILLSWKMCTWIKESENCKLTGVQLNMILPRGQSIKVYRQVLSFMKEYGYIVPNEKVQAHNDDPEGEQVDYDYDPEKYKDINNGGEGYEGAVVVEPIVGFYEEPVVTLDFQSLYPSIMIAHNLCPTTQITREQAEKMNPEDYTKTPAGYYFVKKHVKEGIMPRVLEILLKARADVRSIMKTVKEGSFIYIVLDMRQLKIKINANSVYGFTGASVSKLYTVAVAASVTAFGREMIRLVWEAVEKEFTIEKHGFRVQVIYGDTDSVMCRIISDKPLSNERLFEIGKMMGEFATSCFDEINKTHGKKVILMNFEKIYKPYLLLKKKKYAGVMWTKPQKYDKVDVKGLETVRRETTPFVKKTLERCLSLILLEKDGIQKAIDYAKKRIKLLRSGGVDINELIITKQFNGKRKTKQPHVELAYKMAKRDSSSAPQMGSRIPYVLVKSHKNDATSDKAEDPLYAFKNGIEIDFEFYLFNQLLKPLERIFGMLTDVKTLTEGTKPDKIIKKVYIDTTEVAKKSLITHHFTKKKNMCIGCNRQVAMFSYGVVNPETSYLCAECLNQLPVIEEEVAVNVNNIQSEYDAIYKYCQQCQNTTGEVMCNEKECNVFFLRHRTKRDLDEAIEKKQRLDLSCLNW